MGRAFRRLRTVGLAALLIAPSGCASSGAVSGGAWMAGMMGVMMVGGVMLGTGMMHGIGHHRPEMLAPDSVRFSPAGLLEQRALLELSGEQVAALESLRDEVIAGRRSPSDAARAAYGLLRPVQREAASRRAPSQPPDS